MDLHQRDPIIHMGQSMPIAFPYERQSNLQKFLNGEPAILGVLFLFDARSYMFTRRLEFSYFFLLEPILFITSGTLSIMSAKKMTKKLIQGNLVMNAVSAVTSVPIMVLIARGDIWMIHYMLEDVDYKRPYLYPHLFSSLLAGIMTMIFILFLLQLIISVSLSAFGCKTVCCDHPPVVVCLPSNDRALPRTIPDDHYEEVVYQST
ncbi:membrane-spanning 4-domains subfamily A member 4A-like isoform X2 [Dasypus novemcinctus]|uniref:membrane-spanning 4-domains subfamily A member 4A-like isoform X2 n=1 Tax=Dasypus novemcinctus TaxID=9361 RepID=UPI00032929AA|nr:membrane-spanning 4-domains subfamily A member 4A-like isoform X2 [Dasypus novemcinctus]